MCPHLQKHSAGLFILLVETSPVAESGPVRPLAGLSVLWRACPLMGRDVFRQGIMSFCNVSPLAETVYGPFRSLAETHFGNAFLQRIPATLFMFLQCVSSFWRTRSACRNIYKMCLLLSADMVHLQKHSAGLSVLWRACPSFGGPVRPSA